MIALAVDDEKYALIALCDAIREADGEGLLELHSFSTCSDTLAFAAENRVDIAFLDINMRGMGGLELSKRLREKAPDCRIIFCTAHPDYALDAFAVHADGYLLKPITAWIQQESGF